MCLSIEDLRPHASALANLLDFDLSRAWAETWFRVSPGADIKVIAGSAAGDIFVLCGRMGHVLEVTSDGRAGVLAPGLEPAIQMMATIPNWRDLLKFSGGGDVECMRKSAEILSRQADTKAQQECSGLLTGLGLSPLADPVALLHDSVLRLSPQWQVTAPDGTALGSLFGAYFLREEAGVQYRVCRKQQS